MKSAHRVTGVLLALVLVAGCASTQVSNRQSRIGNERIPRPNRILVYDFGVSPRDVAIDSGLAGQYDPQQEPTQEQLEEGRELGAEVAGDLAARINDMGIPAERATGGTVPQLNDIVIRGYFVSIDPGSAAKRLVIGFGAGAADLQTVVEGYQMTDQGLRKLGSGTVTASGAKGPGAAVPAAVAIATANPIGLIVTSAIKVQGEMSGRSTIKGRGEATAKTIAEQLKTRFEQQGWIQ
jgi:hypothetical protein